MDSFIIGGVGVAVFGLTVGVIGILGSRTLPGVPVAAKATLGTALGLITGAHAMQYKANSIVAHHRLEVKRKERNTRVVCGKEFNPLEDDKEDELYTIPIQEGVSRVKGRWYGGMFYKYNEEYGDINTQATEISASESSLKDRYGYDGLVKK